MGLQGRLQGRNQARMNCEFFWSEHRLLLPLPNQARMNCESAPRDTPTEKCGEESSKNELRGDPANGGVALGELPESSKNELRDYVPRKSWET